MSGVMANDERSVCAVLRAVVGPYAGAEGGRWLDEALAQLGDPPDRTRLRIAFARAGRRLGAAPLEPSAEDAARLRALGIEAPGLPALRDLGRAILLLGALESLPDHDRVACVEHVFRTGELGEQQSIVRVLALLPGAERFVPLAAEATRSNALQVFEALACDNPYPARYLPDPAFNQLVMKAVFSGLPVARIRGLAERTTPELVRMARDFASERRAAGRPVPGDIALIEGLLETKS